MFKLKIKVQDNMHIHQLLDKTIQDPIGWGQNSKTIWEKFEGVTRNLQQILTCNCQVTRYCRCPFNNNLIETRRNHSGKVT